MKKKRYKRNQKNIKLKINIKFFVEGKTEKIYVKNLFRSLKEKFNEVNFAGIKFIPSSNTKSNIKNIENNFYTEELYNDDLVFIIFDADTDQKEKIEFIRKAIKYHAKTIFLISSPAIETWFLLHLTESISNDIPPISQLRNLNPNYKKTKNENALEYISNLYQQALINNRARNKAHIIEAKQNNRPFPIFILKTHLFLTNFDELFEAIDRAFNICTAEG